MKTLYLLRHAKAMMPEEKQSDAQRPLAVRGHEDAQKLGAWMFEHEKGLEHIYSSDAVRTRETHENLAKTLLVSTTFDEQLYLASHGELLHFVQQLPDTQNAVMLLGHNPGLHQLAVSLLSESASSIAPELAYNFPTCACVKLVLNQESWDAIQPGEAALEFYWTRHEVVRG